MRKHTVVSFGGGTNSTGMLVGMHERGERPDAIFFADTGGEKPHTYRHIEEVSDWCEKIGFPRIEVLRGPKYWGPQMVKDGSLEQECIRLGTLPSKAFGFSQCSVKWKLEPANKRMAQYIAEEGIAIENILRCVGFDAGEPQRYERSKGLMERRLASGLPTIKERWPLIEWDWDRDDCVEAIKRAGLNQPGKSSCFFCPSTRKGEILEMKVMYPDLLARALEMERRAMAGEGQAEAARCGLGRSLVWNEFVLQPQQCNLFSNAGIPDVDCGCID